MFCFSRPKVQEASASKDLLPRCSSSYNGSMRCSSSYGSQDGGEAKQRRRLEMEMLSQRTRAVAAERALADVATENKQLQQRVRALEADLAAANMQTALSAANSLARSLSAYEGQAPEALLQELRRLKNKLRQRGEELLQERQKVEALQQELAMQQLAAQGARETRHFEEQVMHPMSLKSPFAMLKSSNSWKQQQQQFEERIMRPVSPKSPYAFEVPKFGDFEESLLHSSNSWKQQQQQQQQQQQPHQRQQRQHGGCSAIGADLLHTEGGHSIRSGTSVSSSSHVRELRQWFEAGSYRSGYSRGG